MGGALTAGPPGPIERRISARVEVASLAGVVLLRLPPGREAVLLNVSQAGACIEATSRLLPGGSVEMHLATQGWSWRGRATVTRCRVSALVPDEGARYVAALQFDTPLVPGGTAALVEAAYDAVANGYVLPDGEIGASGQWAAATRRQPVPLEDEAERRGLPPK
jgi:hypothetical protein